MDPERERIQADLRGLLEGEVRCDDLFVQMYASDASIYEIRPLGVVRPRSESDVAACLQYASENGLPVHARGAGTGLAGDSLGPGLVLDFSHSMRRIIELGDDFVRVQPGVILAQLNRQLSRFGRKFGPDPATRSVTTMGSVVALDASGSHWLQYGSARRHVEQMRVVFADGQIARVGQHRVADAGRSEPSVKLRGIVQRINDLVEQRQEQLEARRPQTLVNRSGYHLWDLLDSERGELDLAKLLVGSDGTLALFTEITLRTQPIPKCRGLALIFFDRLESAAHGAIEVASFGASACDMMDRRLLTIARETDPRYAQLLPTAAEAMLLVEMHGDAPNEVRDRINKIVSRLQRRRRLAFDSRVTLDPEERNFYWRIARRVIPILHRLEGSTRPLPFVEDVAVPPPALPKFLVELQNVFKAHRVTASFFAHAGHGQLHLRPFLSLSDEADVQRMQPLAADLYAEVVKVGGTISGEHGDGLSRTWFVRQQFGELYSAFEEVKQIFDPRGLLNPGKVVAEKPQPLTSNLRPVQAAVGPTVDDPLAKPEQEEVELQIVWQDGELTQTARACNGCGRCRTQGFEERMCPIFRFGPREEASPRAKANLMRAVITGRLAPEHLQSEELKAISDLCVHCHQCRVECPATVNIPKLVLESKAQFVANNGLSSSDWFMTRIDLLARWGGIVRPFSNWMLGNRVMRWMLERLTGIAQGRKLPRLAPRSFLRLAQRRRLTRPPRRESGRKVLYFVDTYANWFDPELAEAAVAVLGHNGVAVYVAPGQLQSGMTAIALGAADAARKLAAKNVALLADAVRQGYHIVATEPSAALCLQHEYPQLIDDDDTRLVAENSSNLTTYLWGLHQTGKLELDLSPINATVGYHQPCHLRAVGSDAGLRLLRLVPGLTVQEINQGCSGMAGAFGLQRKNYRSSLRAGWDLITAMREPTLQAGATECSACKMQMEQGTAKPTVHPLKILALAYRLIPELATRLTQRGEELIVT